MYLLYKGNVMEMSLWLIMEVNNKCLCSRSAVILKERINGTLMISMDVINSFTFDIYNTDPWLPLFYSCLKPR